MARSGPTVEQKLTSSSYCSLTVLNSWLTSQFLDLILDLAIKLEHLDTRTGLISTELNGFSGKNPARKDNSRIDRQFTDFQYKPAYRTKKRSHQISNGE
jgi:hypothetical protein